MGKSTTLSCLILGVEENAPGWKLLSFEFFFPKFAIWPPPYIDAQNSSEIP